MLLRLSRFKGPVSKWTWAIPGGNHAFKEKAIRSDGRAIIGARNGKSSDAVYRAFLPSLSGLLKRETSVWNPSTPTLFVHSRPLKLEREEVATVTADRASLEVIHAALGVLLLADDALPLTRDLLATDDAKAAVRLVHGEVDHLA